MTTRRAFSVLFVVATIATGLLSGAYLGALVVLLVSAMLSMMPLMDWIYPTNGERPRDDRGKKPAAVAHFVPGQ